MVPVAGAFRALRRIYGATISADPGSTACPRPSGRWRSEGFTCLESGSVAGAGPTYIDVVKAPGVSVELLELPEGVPVLGRQ